mgnify:FL=1
MTTFKHRKVQKKRKYGLYALLVGLIAAAILALSVFLLFHIQKIEVTGIEMLTQQEVSDWVKSDTMSGNSLYVLWKSKFRPDKLLPRMKRAEISMKNPWTINVKIEEHKFLGGILYKNEYAYFDEEGTVLKKQTESIPGIPLVEGLGVKKVVLNHKVKAENRKVFSYVIQVGKVVEKWELSPEKIVFNGTEATLHFGTIAVNIGDENFDDRVAQITPILEKLQGKSGIVHLENFTMQSTLISFRPTVEAEDGTVTEGEDQILAETGAPDSGEQTGADSYNEDWEAEPQYDESVTYGDGTEIYDDETGSYEDGSGTYDDGSENYDGTGTYDDGSGMGY